MIVESRMVAVILLYIFTFLGYLLGRTSESEEEKKIKKKRELLEKWVAKHHKNSGNK